MNEHAISPMEAITRFVGEDIVAHEAMVRDATKRINELLPGMFSPVSLYRPSAERPVQLILKGISRAALIEVVLGYRKQGWKASCSTTGDGDPVVMVTLPTQE